MSAASNVVPFIQPSERKAEASRERASELEALRVIDRAAEVLDRLEERSACCARRIAQLQAAKKHAEARAGRIEERIIKAMSARQITKAAGLKRTLTLKTNPAKLEVINQSQVARDFIRTKIIEEVDKSAVKAALAQGRDIDGVRLVQGVSLQRGVN